jgi:hypothetical protein
MTFVMIWPIKFLSFIVDKRNVFSMVNVEELCCGVTEVKSLFQGEGKQTDWTKNLRFSVAGELVHCQTTRAMNLEDP